jgi:hypothetical protein
MVYEKTFFKISVDCYFAGDFLIAGIAEKISC